jgi:hypothetical protein
MLLECRANYGIIGQAGAVSGFFMFTLLEG